MVRTKHRIEFHNGKGISFKTPRLKFCDGSDAGWSAVTNLAVAISEVALEPSAHRKHSEDEEQPMQTTREEHRSVDSSPVKKLPVEILQRIFTFYVQDPLNLDTPAPRLDAFKVAAYNGSRTTPILLGVICKRWRSVIISMPELWSSISVADPQLAQVPIFLLWLERAGQRPLDLAFYENLCITRTPIEDSISLKAILLIAIGHSRRWRTIDICVYNGAHDLFLPHRFLEGSTPNLEAFGLDLRGDWTPYAGTAQRLCRILCASPSLSRAQWGSALDAKTAASVPWKRLTHIDFDCLTEKDLFAILPSCQRLQHLSIARYGPAFGYSSLGTDIPSVMITLPHLRVLHLLFIDEFANERGTFFDWFYLPSLVELKLQCGFGFNLAVQQGWEALSNLLVRSDCTLRTFCISEDGDIQDEALLISNLRSKPFSALRELEIFSRVTKKTLVALGSTNGTPMLAQLESLTLRACYAKEGIISSFLRSRILACPGLARLNIVMQGPSRSYEKDQRLQLPGVQIRIDA